MQLAVAMSLMDQVAALRKFFQPPSEAPLPMQVAMVNEQMGIDGEGTLPKQVDELCRRIGWKAYAVGSMWLSVCLWTARSLLQ